jgi:hypothetical protein
MEVVILKSRPLYPHEKSPRYPLTRRSGFPEPVWTLWRREIPLLLAGIKPWLSSPNAVSALSRLLLEELANLHRQSNAAAVPRHHPKKLNMGALQSRLDLMILVLAACDVANNKAGRRL